MNQIGHCPVIVINQYIACIQPEYLKSLGSSLLNEVAKGGTGDV